MMILALTVYYFDRNIGGGSLNFYLFQSHVSIISKRDVRGTADLRGVNGVLWVNLMEEEWNLYG